jgi:hypothetical protein
MQGKWPGKEEAVQASPFPVFRTRSQRGGVKTTRRLVRARLSPPNGGGDLSSATSTMGRCGIHTPLHFERYCQRRRRGQRESDTLPPVSFRFERGQHSLPLFLFFSKGGSKCCPPLSFLFERGQHTLPPFLSISNGGGVQPTCRRRFFRLPPVSLPCSVDKRGSVEPTRRRRFFRLPPPNNRGVSPCLPPNHGGFVFFASIILY